MGNCLDVEGKLTKIKKDEVLLYSAPLQVQHVLSDYEGHAIVESPSASHHLQPEIHLRGCYHLLPVPSPEPEKQKSTDLTPVNAEKEATDGDGRFAGSSGGLIRIKLVMTKQQLAEMLNKGISMEDMISGHCGKILDSPNSRGWTPSLRSIAEASDELQELP